MRYIILMKIKYIISVYLKFGLRSCVSANGLAGLEPGKMLPPPLHWSRVWQGPKYRFPSRINFKKCREEIASALNDFGNRWCKREYVEPDALKELKVSSFKIVDQRIKFYSQNTNLLPPKPKSTFRHLKQGIQDFHRKYVLVPADKAANNIVVV